MWGCGVNYPSTHITTEPIMLPITKYLRMTFHTADGRHRLVLPRRVRMTAIAKSRKCFGYSTIFHHAEDRVGCSLAFEVWKVLDPRPDPD